MTSNKADAARRIADTPLVWLMVLRVVVVTALMGSAVVAEVIRRPRGVGDPLYFLIALTYLLTLVYALVWPFTASYRPDLWHRDFVGYFLRSMHGSGGWDKGHAELFATFVSDLNTCHF